MRPVCSGSRAVDDELRPGLAVRRHPRHAETDAIAGLLLLLAQEDVPVIDPAGVSMDAHGAQSALALAAVPHHLDAGLLERVERRQVLRYDDRAARTRD